MLLNWVARSFDVVQGDIKQGKDETAEIYQKLKRHVFIALLDTSSPRVCPSNASNWFTAACSILSFQLRPLGLLLIFGLVTIHSVQVD
jgi:hypothetical protein